MNSNKHFFIDAFQDLLAAYRDEEKRMEKLFFHPVSTDDREKIHLYKDFAAQAVPFLSSIICEQNRAQQRMEKIIKVMKLIERIK